MSDPTPDPYPPTVTISPRARRNATDAVNDAMDAVGRSLTEHDLTLILDTFLAALGITVTAPTPRPPDHGAAGFCTNHAQPAGTDPRIEAARAEAMRRWPGQGDAGWVRHGYVLGFATAVAALDDETEALTEARDDWAKVAGERADQRDAARAEAERLSRIVNGYDRTPAEQRAADAEAEVERLQDGIQDAIPYLGDRELAEPILRAALLPPAVGRRCGWCGGPHHDPGDCTVAQQAEEPR